MPRPKHDILEQLYRTNADSLIGFVDRRIGPQDAEDLVQNAFLRLAEADPERPIENPLGYLYRISANLVVDHLRYRQRRSDLAASEDEALDVPDLAPDVEAAVFSRQQVELLKQALRELPPRSRQVFILHKFKHLSYGEIATRLDISESTVVKHMVKALAHCKRRVYGEAE
jgi:RNA polymerase sigma-70 factor (ECF subfamily)